MARLNFVAPILILFGLLWASEFSSPTRADPDTDDALVHVVVAGIGRTVDEAQRDAWRNAVAQVVGVFVDTETVVRNDKLLNDQLLTHSAGYIERSKQVSSESSDGLVRVRIEAWVRKTQVQQRVAALQLVTTQLDGASINAEIISRREQAGDAKVLLEKALEPFLRQQFVKIGDVQKGKVEVSEHGAVIPFTVKLGIDSDAYARFRDNLVAILTQIGASRVDLSWLSAVRMGRSDLHGQSEGMLFDSVRARISAGYRGPKREGGSLQIIIQDGTELAAYALPPGSFPASKIWSMVRPRAGDIKLRIKLLDGSGRRLAASDWGCLYEPDSSGPLYANQGCTESNVHNFQVGTRFGFVHCTGNESPERGTCGMLGIGISNVMPSKAATDLVYPESREGTVAGTVSVGFRVRLTDEQAAMMARAEVELLVLGASD